MPYPTPLGPPADADRALSHAHADLDHAGLKVTHQRLVILAQFRLHHQHLSAENVYDSLKADHPTLSLGTVYRTLDTFADQGILKRVPTEDGKLRYDANTHPHHHLICQQSQRIVDYYHAELQALLEQHFSRHPVPGFRVSDFQLHIHGRITDESALPAVTEHPHQD